MNLDELMCLGKRKFTHFPTRAYKTVTEIWTNKCTQLYEIYDTILKTTTSYMLRALLAHRRVVPCTHKHTVTVKVKVKVKFTLEQATEAQRGSRGIALLFP